MTKTVKRNVVVSAILAIMLCVSLIAGATFALFTSESKVNIAVTSGKVSVLASIDETSVQTKQLNSEYAQGANNMFEASASFDDNGLTLEKLVPGDAIKFNIVVKNESTVTVQYRTIISCESDNGLFAGLNVNVEDKEGYNGVTFVSDWAQLAVGVEDAIVPVSIELPEDADNEYQDKTCTVSYKVEAVQGNAQVENPEDGVIYIYSANDLMALSNFVAKEDTVIELCSDLNMQNQEIKSLVAWYSDLTFIGNGYTISNVRFERNSEYNNGGAAGDSMFYTSTSSTLNVSDLKFVNAKTEAGTDGRYSAIVDSYPQGAVTLSNVDVEGSAVVGTKSSGVLFGHMESSVVVENCDVKNSTVTLASCTSEPDGHYAGKVVGTIGGGATLTMNDCSIENVTVDGSLNAKNVGEVYGRCLGKLVVNGKLVVFTTSELLNAIKNAPVGETTEIYLAADEYAGDIAITVANLGKSGGDVVIKAFDGVQPVITGTVTLGYRNQGVGATMYDANVMFEGIKFDQANLAHSIDIQDVKSLTLKNCTIVGEADHGIVCARGNATGQSTIVGCTFENAGLQLLGNYATGLVIDDCDFEDSCINVQAGNGVTVKNCRFKSTLSQAHVGESFYLIRSNSTPITVENCTFDIDSELTEVAGDQAKWGIMWNRGTANWTVSGVVINKTTAAQTQTQLIDTKCTSTGAINVVD